MYPMRIELRQQTIGCINWPCTPEQNLEPLSGHVHNLDKKSAYRASEQEGALSQRSKESATWSQKRSSLFSGALSASNGPSSAIADM